MKYAWGEIKEPLAAAISALWSTAVEKIPILGTIGDIIAKTMELLVLLFPPVAHLAALFGYSKEDTADDGTKKGRWFDASRSLHEGMLEREEERIAKYGKDDWRTQLLGGADLIGTSFASFGAGLVDAVVQPLSFLATGSTYQMNWGAVPYALHPYKVVVENRSKDELDIFTRVTAQRDIDRINETCLLYTSPSPRD